MRYIKQLDAMRAIAILFVFCNHASTKGSLAYKASLLVSAPDIFFTISGFLITTILFKDKIAYDNQKTTKSVVFKAFFIKRILRIFPAYYLTILITYLINKNGVSRLTPFLNFTANYEISTNQEWGRLAHLWSMSVEQQFYLIWPFAIIFTPRKYLPYTIGTFVAIGLASHIMLPDNQFTDILPQNCFDALGLGALLAWITTYRPDLFPRAHRVLSYLAVASVGIIAVKAVIAIPFLPFVFHRTFISLITVWLISYFIYNKEIEGGRIGFIFNNKQLILFGKFSYGFYLFHIPCLYYSYKLLYAANQLLPFYGYIAESHKLYIAENFIIITGLAWLSWRYFELPMYAFQKQFISMARKERPNIPELLAQRDSAVAEVPQLTTAK
ncbi:acyltransferase family protein [Hymenobacter wooponensis]|uniref:Acyltransferase n=1 Tax=Hymenobacter wooponensis TaxID=1525360 RepID=A0A4Z0MJ01_9BACT|nr:acyltransferase [Hymenobacter wooponensis]TGD79524.1 acyltransferase [Hymenobacter wooponensis]